MLSSARTGETAGNEIQVRHGRIEFLCDAGLTSEGVLKNLGDAKDNILVILRIPSDSPVEVCETALVLRQSLMPSVRRVLIAVEVCEDCDGTAAYLDPANPIHGVLASTQALRSSGDDLYWSVALTLRSVWKLDGLHSLARDKDMRLSLIPSDKCLPPDAQLFAWDYVNYAMLGEFRGFLSNATRAYYEAMRDVLAKGDLGQKREADGAVFPSGTLLTDALTNADRATGPASQIGLSDIREVAGIGLKAHASSLRASKIRTTIPERMERAVLVGAYGGEHIGDIAILGGVLRRMHEEFGLRSAVLMTQRPLHTRHLVEMIDTPVDMVVADYQPEKVLRHLESADVLIHAGGPLTDIPKQLVRHLHAASHAKRMKLPFLMEGIGPNDFRRMASRVTAGSLVRLADRITLRCSDDVRRPIISGLDVSVGRDPAFDYLASRDASLSKLQPGEEEQIDSLVNNAEGRPLVGVNIRPIYALFNKGRSGEERVSHTRQVEDRMERALAEGLSRFTAESEKPPRFIFFPMNAIQFGMSDNRSAYRIVRHLTGAVDARVWQADASLDAVIALIRRLDTAITMRFHAAIFALSQGCMPIGIDYRIGKKDKVAAVMEDNGQSEFCCRIDELDADWIADRLRKRISDASN